MAEVQGQPPVENLAEDPEIEFNMDQERARLRAQRLADREEAAREDAAMRRELAELIEQQRHLQQAGRRDDLRELAAALQQPRQQKVKAPTYDGTKDIRKFFQTFEDVRRHNQWGDQQAALELKLSLGDKISESVQGITYAELREFLLQRYELSREEARRALKVTKPKKGESVYDYGDHILQLVKLANPNVEQQQQEDIAVEEIVDSINDWVLRREFRNNPPNSFAEALRRINEYNADRGERAVIRRVDFNLQEDDKEISELKSTVNQLKEEMVTLKNDVTGLNNGQKEITAGQSAMLTEIRMLARATSYIAPSPVQPQPSFVANKTCSYCKRTGHVVEDCRTKRRADSNQVTTGETRTCYFCGKPGHLIGNCEQRKNAEVKQTKLTGNANGPAE